MFLYLLKIDQCFSKTTNFKEVKQIIHFMFYIHFVYDKMQGQILVL